MTNGQLNMKEVQNWLAEKVNQLWNVMYNYLRYSNQNSELIDDLETRWSEHFQLKNNEENDTEIIFLRKRSIDNLIECAERLKACIENIKSYSLDLAAEDLRLAQNLLLEITGKISNELVLEEIFSRFCIGK